MAEPIRKMYEAMRFSIHIVSVHSVSLFKASLSSSWASRRKRVLVPGELSLQVMASVPLRLVSGLRTAALRFSFSLGQRCPWTVQCSLRICTSDLVLGPSARHLVRSSCRRSRSWLWTAAQNVKNLEVEWLCEIDHFQHHRYAAGSIDGGW